MPSTSVSPQSRLSEVTYALTTLKSKHTVTRNPRAALRMWGSIFRLIPGATLNAGSTSRTTSGVVLSRDPDKTPSYDHLRGFALSVIGLDPAGPWPVAMVIGQPLSPKLRSLFHDHVDQCARAADPYLPGWAEATWIALVEEEPVVAFGCTYGYAGGGGRGGG